jgi:transcription antitermination factor NusG
MTSTTNDIVKKWYVVRAVSGKEKKVNVHWKNCILYCTCKNCNREYRYKFNNWELISKKKEVTQIN